MSNINIVKSFIDAWNEMNFEKVLSLLSEDVIYHNIPMDVINGREAVGTFINGLQGMEKVDWDLLNIAENGNVVLTERVDNFVFSGKPVSVPVMGVFEISDGEICAWRDYFDLPTFVNQME